MHFKSPDRTVKAALLATVLVSSGHAGAPLQIQHPELTEYGVDSLYVQAAGPIKSITNEHGTQHFNVYGRSEDEIRSRTSINHQNGMVVIRENATHRYFKDGKLVLKTTNTDSGEDIETFTYKQGRVHTSTLRSYRRPFALIPFYEVLESQTQFTYQYQGGRLSTMTMQFMEKNNQQTRPPIVVKFAHSIPIEHTRGKETFSRNTQTYQYDQYGNWIKKFKDNKLIASRTITYHTAKL